MNIQQNILKKNIKNIEKIIINLKNTKPIINHKIFFPKKKNWFDHYLKILKKIIKFNNETLSLVYYKQNGYIEINKLLIHKSLPYVFMFNMYDNNTQSIFNKKTIIDTKPIYIFPDDIKKISEYKKNTLLNHINNIDFLYKTFYKNILLDDCILFRGMHHNETKKGINKFLYDFYDNNSKKLNFKKGNNFLFDNYVSTSLNIKTVLSGFFSGYNNGTILVIKIKKEHNVPGLYLPDSFFNKSVIEKDKLKNFYKRYEHEFEILLNRNFTIKINNIKKINLKKYINVSKINNIYSNKKDDDKKDKKHKKDNTVLTIVFAESCPYTLPDQFVLNNDYKYMCGSL
jgi:hypothetical protein